MFMSSSETDNSRLFSGKPNYRKNSQYFCHISKCLSPDLTIADNLEYQPVAVGKDEPRIGEVKLMLLKVHQPFGVIPDHIYCIYDNGLVVK